MIFLSNLTKMESFSTEINNLKFFIKNLLTKKYGYATLNIGYFQLQKL